MKRFGVLALLVICGAIGAIVIMNGAPTPASQQSACATPDGSDVRIPGGTFLMGSSEYPDEEGPVRPVTVAAFSIDRFDVTNAQFAAFVAATGYVTDAERTPSAEDYPDLEPDQLVAGGAVFVARADAALPQQNLDWWQFTPRADWRHPFGPDSTIVGRDNDPVVQVSYNDALAYARWRGRELPTEEQYEYAARGGLDGKTYAWGNEMTPDGRWMANTWQGAFPNEGKAEDGYDRIAAAGCFPPNGYGLYDMIGNVWKWTATPWEPDTDPNMPPSRLQRVIKGGSFMCSTDFCRRFRPAARQPQESGFSSVHLGFRTVKNGAS